MSSIPMYHSVTRSHKTGWRGGSIARASDSRSKDQRFEPRQEHNKHIMIGVFFRVKNIVLTHRRCAQPPVCIRTHKNDQVRTLKILWTMSEFGGFRKHEQTQHALYNYLDWVARLCCCSLLLWKATGISHGKKLHWDQKV